MSLKQWIGIVLIAACLCGLTACGSNGNSNSSVSYIDGTYEGRSSVYTSEDGSEDSNGYGEVTITIKDDVIAECTYQTYEPDGTLKDEDYGKVGGQLANRDYYNKAQKAVAACGEYASRLIENGSTKDVDAVSGATINYDLFCEAVDDALSKAKESK